ncbi:MAG TPA: peptidylprolyl isomerase [Thermoanaerobaculia bacterium]|jgi:peptidyl-prolyl cis-trans isomerase C
MLKLDKTISPRLTLLTLGLALLLSLAAGCKQGADKGTAAGPGNGLGNNAAPATSSAQTPAPAAGQAATPAGPGEFPGAPPAAGQPGKPGARTADNTPLDPSKLPAVVAKVNGQPIKKTDLLQGGQMVQMRFSQMGQQIAPSARFYQQVLKELVAIILLQQDAKAQGVTASDQEIQQAVASRKAAFPNEEAYQKALKQAGITEQTLKDQARDQIAVQKYVQTRIAPGVTVSDQAAKEFYDKNKAQMQMPERVHLRHILIQVSPTASPADKQKARQKAEEVLKKLQAGGDFAKLAAQYSEDPGSKDRGGDIGAIGHGQAAPQFEAAAFALQKPNDLSPVVESRYGYQIIQLLEKLPATTVPFEQVKERIVAGLKQQELQKLVQARAEQLRVKGKVETYI